MGKTMSSSSLLSIIIIFITLLIMAVCCLAKNYHVTLDCFPGEIKALLRFKASFSDDPSNRLSSWKANTGCCSWAGVECDNATGHVVKLDLTNIVADEYGHLSRDSRWLTSDKIHSSLLELNYLSYLDLSGNDFQGSSIPVFLGSMKQMEYLGLFQANFGGIVPHQLGNLSRLCVLALGGEYEYLRVDDVMWAGNLSSLEYIYMSQVNLSGIEDVVYKVLNMLPSLVGLHLSNCGLGDTNLLHANCVNSTLLVTNVEYLDMSSNSFGENSSFCFLHNMTSLSFLDLSSNSLHQKYSDWISDFLWDKCHLKTLHLDNNQFYGDISEALIKNISGCWGHTLESLNLGDNEFNGHLPEDWGELKQLTELFVSNNKLSGLIPSSIGNLKALRSLDLSYNQLVGEIPVSLGQLSNLETIFVYNNKLSGPIPSSIGNLKSLRSLYLSDNHLGGEIPISLGQLSNLESMHVSGNNLCGHIPSSLENLRALRELDLSHNQLGGKIPIYLGQLSNLETMGLYNNSFEGTLLEVHFANLSRLEDLHIGLKLNVKDNWVPPFQLYTLMMRSNRIEGQFPQWIKTQKSLQDLDLSNYSISGTLPAWLDSLKNLTSLDLSNNHIEGPIPHLPSGLNTLNLARNLINGSIQLPGSFLCQMKGLEFLDLSRNHLSGHLPDCNWGHLYSLILSHNQFSGPIPNSIGGGGHHCALEWLQLNNNSLTGQLPSTLKNCTSLLILDVGENELSRKLPEWIGEDLEFLAVLRLRNNKFDGDIPSAYCQLFIFLQIMDLAHNHLTGIIPHCFGNLSGMIYIAPQGSEIGSSSLNEVMKGVMLEYTRTLRFLVTLDLSSNHLSGEIPMELTNLIALNGLNFSYNHLVGQIPQMIGDLKSLESLDLSNNNFSGEIPGGLSKLMSLSCLNLSNNDLSGPIPTGPQLQSLNDPSIYEGNPRLCGTPLVKKCRVFPVLSRKVENNDGGMKDKIYLYAFITSGLATGFWGYFGVLVFKRSWRLALFRYMDVVIGKLLGRY